MFHRILAVDGRDAQRPQLAGELTGAFHRDQRIVRAVLHEHGRGVALVEIERGGVERGAHRERGLRPGTFASLERKAERQAATLGEPRDDRFVARQAQRLGLVAEQVVEFGERVRVGAFGPVAFEHSVPGVSG